jgi:cytochrome c1
MKRTVFAVLLTACFMLSGVSPSARAAEAVAVPAQPWSFDGLFGTFDRGALQRGYQVYAQVCKSCHAMSLIAYRNLTEIGFAPEQVAAIAAGFEVEDGPNDEGEMFTRPGRPADRFAAPFPNEQAARFANNGAYPVDQSLIIKARKDGANYVHALLTGYRDPAPEGVQLMDGMYYNDYFPGHQIAMAPPLVDGGVEYTDGTESTIDQMSRDVVTFLTWAAEPKLGERKRLGIKVMLFTLVLTAMLYALKRQIWSDVH